MSEATEDLLEGRIRDAKSTSRQYDACLADGINAHRDKIHQQFLANEGKPLGQK